MGGNQPAVVANGNENTNFHTYLSAVVEEEGAALHPASPGSPRRKIKQRRCQFYKC
jgi:hypothetical protein